MSEIPVNWDKKPKMLAADPVASIALDRGAWEELGATFDEVDDNDGESPGLATGSAQTDDGPVEIGVLDYGENTTYMLVPGVEPERLSATAAVLGSLEAAGALRLETDLVDLVDGIAAPTLDDRVANLERIGAESREPVEGVFGRYKVRTPVFAGAKTGRVKWSSDNMGLGIITPDDGDKDLFVHHTSFDDTAYRSVLVKGKRVALETLGNGDVKIVPLDEPRAKS